MNKNVDILAINLNVLRNYFLIIRQNLFLELNFYFSKMCESYKVSFVRFLYSETRRGIIFLRIGTLKPILDGILFLQR